MTADFSHDVVVEKEWRILSGDHWQWAVFVVGSTPGMNPLLRLSGLGGVANGGEVLVLEVGSNTEQLF